MTSSPIWSRPSGLPTSILCDGIAGEPSGNTELSAVRLGARSARRGSSSGGSPAQPANAARNPKTPIRAGMRNIDGIVAPDLPIASEAP